MRVSASLAICIGVLYASELIPCTTNAAPAPGINDWNPLYPVFRSSKKNEEIASKNYAVYDLQYWMALTIGDEMPALRDDLIRRKNDGEGFLTRYYHALTNETNWEVDPDNNKIETEDPYQRQALFKLN